MGRKDTEGRSDVEKFRKTIGEAFFLFCMIFFNDCLVVRKPSIYTSSSSIADTVASNENITCCSPLNHIYFL